MSDSGEKSFIHLILAKLGMIKIGEEERKTVLLATLRRRPAALFGAFYPFLWFFLCGALRFV